MCDLRNCQMKISLQCKSVVVWRNKRNFKIIRQKKIEGATITVGLHKRRDVNEKGILLSKIVNDPRRDDLSLYFSLRGETSVNVSKISSGSLTIRIPKQGVTVMFTTYNFVEEMDQLRFIVDIISDEVSTETPDKGKDLIYKDEHSPQYVEDSNSPTDSTISNGLCASISTNVDHGNNKDQKRKPLALLSMFNSTNINNIKVTKPNLTSLKKSIRSRKLLNKKPRQTLSSMLLLSSFQLTKKANEISQIKHERKRNKEKRSPEKIEFIKKSRLVGDKSGHNSSLEGSEGIITGENNNDNNKSIMDITPTKLLDKISISNSSGKKHTHTAATASGGTSSAKRNHNKQQQRRVKNNNNSTPSTRGRRTMNTRMITTPKRMKPITSFFTKKVSPAANILKNSSKSIKMNQLSKEQMIVLNLVESGESVFFTGAAGTGKSLLLKKILEILPKRGTYATASTGVAASNISGSTLHQWGGLRASDVGSIEPESFAKRILRSHEQSQRWRLTKVLIIDEISMIDGDIFDFLEKSAKIIRQRDEAFGGIQLIICGDFYQLPPVSISNYNRKKYCFQATSWSEAVRHNIELKTVFRQKDDKFITLLNEIRRGICSDTSMKLLRSCVNRVFDSTNGITPTELYTHKKDVDLVNVKQLQLLDGKCTTYTSRDSGSKQHISRMTDTFAAPQVLYLKIGAQVVLTKSIRPSEGLVNGLRGIVTKISGKSKFPYVLFSNGTESLITYESWHLIISGQQVATRHQLPLMLGWALSIHRSQGMTLDQSVITFSHAFEYGQAYVALSRVRSLEGLSIKGGINPRAIKASIEVQGYYNSFKDSSNY